MSAPEKDGNQHQYLHQQQPPPPPPPHQYGSFEGVNYNYPPQPVIGLPQPVPPPGTPGGPPVNPYVHGYQGVSDSGYTIDEGRPVRERRLPCCGIGIGGFFCNPWYVGAFILLCAPYDAREKPGYVACLIAAILGTIALIFGVTR